MRADLILMPSVMLMWNCWWKKTEAATATTNMAHAYT